MSDFDPRTWSPFVLGMYTLGVLHLGGFFGFFFGLRAAERKARRGEAGAVIRYNRLLKGFPNAFYAKLLGRRALEATDADDGKSGTT